MIGLIMHNYHAMQVKVDKKCLFNTNNIIKILLEYTKLLHN